MRPLDSSGLRVFSMEALGLKPVVGPRGPRGRRRIDFRVVPDAHLEPSGAGDSRWRIVGAVPAVRLDPGGDRFPVSWVLLDLDMQAQGEPRQPLLRIDEGRGLDHGPSICLPRLEQGRNRTVVLLPSSVRGIRLDLRGCRGELRLGKVSMREIGKMEVGIRRALSLLPGILRRPQRWLEIVRRTIELVRARDVQTLKNRLAGTDRCREEYERWVECFDRLDADDEALIHERIGRLARRPAISIIMPVYNPPERWLRRAIESVEAQLYPDWQLCIADDASTEPHVARVLAECAERDPRIALVRRDRNGHIAEASNSALALATGEFVALLDHDDELPPHALYLIAEEINAHPDVDVIYSDEDKIDESGRRYEVYFKPDWSPDLFGSQNLVSHLGVYRSTLVRAVGGFRSGLDGSQDYDLALRCVRVTPPERVRHVPWVLYHWRAIESSTASGGRVKDYAFRAARRALQEHHDLEGEGASVSFGAFLALYRVRRQLPKPAPLVSLVVDTRGGCRALRWQLLQLRLRTAYPHLELLVVGGEPRDPDTRAVLEELEDNGWARVMCDEAPASASVRVNAAAREARGGVLALLDWSLQPVNHDWLAEMVAHCMRPEIGAVGARLLSPDGSTWHAGVVLDVDEIAVHPYRGLPADAHGYFGRAQAIQNYSAVSGDCLVVRREIFAQVGGFDPEHLPGRWSDVDFCLRLREAGYRNLWTPYAQLRRVGGCRDAPTTPDADRAAADWMRRRWGGLLACDPCHSPNLSLQGGRPVLAWPPRRRPPWRDAPAASALGPSGDAVRAAAYAPDPTLRADLPAARAGSK